MRKKAKLSKSMTEAEFTNGYWYATEIKKFAKELGITSVSRLRKDEIEKLILSYLKNEKIHKPPFTPAKTTAPVDHEKGLSLELLIINYRSNKPTKSFLMREALKIEPDLTQKSGAWYWLNRWREDQMNGGTRITYLDLVKQFVKLNQTDGRLPRIPSTRFNNFITDFLARENRSSRQRAVEAWEELKTLEIPKNYRSWRKFRNSRRKLDR